MVRRREICRLTRRNPTQHFVRSAFEAMTAPAWASEPCLLGVDEAGRGPVLGPMVYGVAFTRIEAKEALANRAFADSKTLSEEKREKLHKEIEEDESLGYAIDCISAAEISAKMLQLDKVSLNDIAMSSTTKLIRGVLDLGVNLKEVYCDTVGDPLKWKSRLEAVFGGIEFVVCPKADALYPIVSAASIVAKVTRDRAMHSCLQNEPIPAPELPLGSGYPADPLTVAWMKANIDPIFGFPQCVRFAWSTACKLLQEHAVPVQWEADEDFDSQQQKIHFKGSKRKASSVQDFSRHSFFRSRKLQQVESF